jgi:hypothetical protein
MFSVLGFRTRSQFLQSTPDKCSFELIFATRPNREVGGVELGIFPARRYHAEIKSGHDRELDRLSTECSMIV